MRHPLRKVALLLAPLSLLQATDYDWNGTQSSWQPLVGQSSWDVLGAPVLSYPNSSGDAGTFYNTGSQNLILQGNLYTLGYLNFSSNASNYSLFNGTLSFSGIQSQINVLGGTQNLFINVDLSELTTITVDGTLIFNSGNVGSSIAVSAPIQIGGSGVLTNYTGGFGNNVEGLELIGPGVVNNFGSMTPDYFSMSGGTLNNIGSLYTIGAPNTYTIVGNPLASCVINNTGSFADVAGAAIEIEYTNFNNANGATAANGANSIIITQSTINNASQFAALAVAGSPFFEIGFSTVNNTNASFSTIQYPLETLGTTINNINSSFSYFSLQANDTTINSNGGSITSAGNGTALNASTINMVNTTFQENGSITLQNTSALNVGSGSTVSAPQISFLDGNNNSITNNGLVQLAAFSSIAVSSGNSIGGAGTFTSLSSSSNLTSSGLVIPGDPTGTLTLQNMAYIQNPDGTFLINVGRGTAGQLVSTTASLSGTLDVQVLPYATGGTYPIIVAPGGVMGTFDTVQFLNFSPNFLGQVIYEPTEVILEVSPVLDHYYGNYYYTLFSTLNQINYLLQKHFDDIHNNYFCCFDECGRFVSCNDCTQFVLYGGPLVSLGNIASHDSQIGLFYDTAGVIVGADYIMTCAALGLEIDYTWINGWAKKRLGSFDDHHYHINGYALYAPMNELLFSAIVGGGGDEFQFKRQGLKGNTGGYHFDALLGAQYSFSSHELPFLKQGTLITPMASIQYLALNVGKFSERNVPSQAARFDPQKYQSVRSLVGFNATWCSYLIDRPLLPSVNFSWQREFYDDRRDLHLSTAGTSINQQITILPGNRNVYLFGFDLRLLIQDNWDVQLGYQFEGNSHFNNNLLSVLFNGTF